MTTDQVIYACLAGIVTLVCLAGYLLSNEAREREAVVRVTRVVSTSDDDTTRYSGLLKLLHGTGEQFRRLYSKDALDHLRGVVVAAGFNPNQVLPILLGAKTTMMVLLPILAFIGSRFVESMSIKLAIIGAGIVVGIVGPELILGMVRRRFVAAVERGTPDALDLLVVCSEAGMGLETALERVSQEMVHSNPQMASMLASLLNDLRVLANRRDAFDNFGARSGVAGLRRCSSTLSQSLEYGTPLTHALRSVANELRQERINTLEGKAIKLPALLIFPMVFFIMPSLYIVLLGTSFLRLYDALAPLIQ
jgi:tight adherence protein C